MSGVLGLARGNASSVLASEALPFLGLSDIIIAETGSHLTVALSSRLQVHGCNFSAATAPFKSRASLLEFFHDFHPRRPVFFWGFSS